MTRFFSTLTKGQQVTIIAAVLGGCCLIVAALIGLGVPAVGLWLQQGAERRALATPTFLPPTGAVELPGSQEDALSVVINPYSYSTSQGIITRDLDPSETPIKKTKEDVLFVGEVSPQISGVDDLLVFEIYLTGKAIDEEVQVTSRIPIRVTHEALPDGKSLYSMGGAGGVDIYGLLGADVSSESQQVWAVNSPELRKRFEIFETCPACINPETVCPQCSLNNYQLPGELLKYLSSNDQNFPDYFLLRENEKIAIAVVVFFKEAGIYRLQIGVEYIYRQYKTITWTEPEIEVYVPKNFFIWSCDNAYFETSPESTCDIVPACVTNADGTYDCEGEGFIHP